MKNFGSPLAAIVFLWGLACLPASLPGAALDPASIAKAPPGSWLTYNGDYSGRRFSPLDQIHSKNVRDLSLAWVYKANPGQGGGPFGVSVKATPLVLDGVLYLTVPDHAWAVDARTGREIWHYKWESKGGIHIGNRGVAIYGNWVFFETPDNHLISLEKDTGKFRWSVEIADLAQEYFSTPAPLVVGNHVLVGVGGDSLDVPGFLEARDPEDGKVQWRWKHGAKEGRTGIGNVA